MARKSKPASVAKVVRVATIKKPKGAVKVVVQLVASAPAPIKLAYCPVPAVACDFHTPGAVLSPLGPPHAGPAGKTSFATGAGVIDAEGAAGEGEVEPVGELESVADLVGEPEGVKERV